jgi:hypothetical protein
MSLVINTINTVNSMENCDIQYEKKLTIYNVFHSKIFPELYSEMNEEDKQYITFYGVKTKENTEMNIIYENSLNVYNQSYQRNWYNEASALYHIYMNMLYKKSQFIGLCQYDMKFSNTTIPNILSDIDEKTIYVYWFFPWWFLGGQKIIVKNLNVFKCGLKSYNDFFNTNYTEETVIKNRMITCNTFVISSKLFEKMMSWMIQYYVNDELEQSYFEHESNCTYNAGNIIEALVGMFFALEVEQGYKYGDFSVAHDTPERLYKNQCL